MNAYPMTAAVLRRAGAGLALSLSIAAPLLAPAAALEAANPPLPRPVPVFEGTIDLSAAAGSPENLASIEFLEKLPSAPEMIYLDLTIAPAQPDAGNPAALDFGATAYDRGTGQPLAAFPCQAGSWQMIDRGVGLLTVTPAPLSTHLVLSIEVAAREAPFNFMSCDYAPGLPSQVALHVAGFFVVQETTIPTARGLRLVPYTPPHAEAMDALQKSLTIIRTLFGDSHPHTATGYNNLAIALRGGGKARCHQQVDRAGFNRLCAAETARHIAIVNPHCTHRNFPQARRAFRSRHEAKLTKHGQQKVNAHGNFLPPAESDGRVDAAHS